MNNYTLHKSDEQYQEVGVFEAVKKFKPLLKHDKKHLALAGIASLITAGLSLIAPLLAARIVDKHLLVGDLKGVLINSGFLLLIYITAAAFSYYQTLFMGTVGQNLLFSLRNEVFNKLQQLPVAFFNQNKAGDLISRINNDTDKLNQFFSRGLIQFLSGIISIIGAAIFVLLINWRLGLAMLAPAAVIILLTMFLSSWIKKRNAKNLKSTGNLSAGIQESLENFKVVVAFNRRDYFRTRFAEVNTANYEAATSAGIANNTLIPVYGFATNIAQLIVTAYGIYLVTHSLITIGALLSFLTYVVILYTPMRQIASIWSMFQVALSGWERIHDILVLNTNLEVIKTTESKQENTKLLSFQNVHFGYGEKEVLHNISFELEKGKTYALVGPTGGGKTTTASLMARLYDPTKGKVLLNGKDIRSFDPEERAQKIGFILQEPFMFSGTIRDNIIYGNAEYKDHSTKDLEAVIKQAGLERLLEVFDQGLETSVAVSGNSLSLGQKQLIAFIRTLLRKPELLILDEATANIDTVTEQLLEDILKKLPNTTTKVVIAHRLNTIENADEIFFVNSGEVTPAGSMQHAVDMLLHGKRNS